MVVAAVELSTIDCIGGAEERRLEKVQERRQLIPELQGYSASTVLGTILNHGALRGVDAGLSMSRTLVESIGPQTVSSCRELEALQPLSRGVCFPGIFSTNTAPAPMCVSSAGRWRKGLPVDQGSGGETAVDLRSCRF